MPTGDATWRVGTITVPSVTGSMSITGLGGTPKAVFFYGSNFLTEDAAITSTGTGLFRGMAAPKWDALGTILNLSSSVVPAGDSHHQAAAPTNPYCMNMLDTSGNLSFLYVSGVTSFDADGFTLNWVTAAAGGYKVVYVALMDVSNVGGYIGTYSTSLALGWKAGAAVMQGAFNGPDVGDGDRNQEFYGSAAYPGTAHGGWKGAGLTAFAFPTLSGQYIVDIQSADPTTTITSGGHFTGPFLIPSNIVVHPTGGSFTDLLFGGDLFDGGMVVAWDDEDTWASFETTPDNAGDTVTVSGLSFAPGLVMGYSVSDEPVGQGSGTVRGALGFSVVTPDFQWCALVDGVSSRGAFQSFSDGWADNVSGTTIHAGTMDLTDDGFVMTTVEDSLNPSGQWVYHAFGHPFRRVMWLPHIYRLVKAGVGATRFVPPPPLEGLVLLEDGGRIILEDGSGFLEYG